MVGVDGLVASQRIWFLVLGRFAGRAGVHSFDAMRFARILWSVLVEDIKPVGVDGLVARNIIRRVQWLFRPTSLTFLCAWDTMLFSAIFAGRCSLVWMIAGRPGSNRACVILIKFINSFVSNKFHAALLFTFGTFVNFGCLPSLF